MVFDNEIVYTLLPNEQAYGIKTNDIGCLGDNVLPGKSEGEFRVLLLGGSTSFSLEYVDYVRKRLKERLHEKGGEVRVTSCGKPRYTSHVSRTVLERFISSAKPDVIGLYMGINDNIYNSFPWLDGLPNVGFFDFQSGGLLSWQVFSYYVIDKSIRSVKRFSGESLRSVSILRKNLDEIAALAVAHDAKLATTTFAIAYPTTDETLMSKIIREEPLMQHFWGDIDSTVYGVKKHNEALRVWALDHQVSLTEFAEAVPRNGKYFKDACHMTPEGYEILSKHMTDAIISAVSTEMPNS
jgi:lysophospholipase L1-like esterase